jgi:hypothetical protein
LRQRLQRSATDFPVIALPSVGLSMWMNLVACSLYLLDRTERYPQLSASNLQLLDQPARSSIISQITSPSISISISTLAKQTCTFSNNLRISFRLRVSESSFLSHVQSPTFRMVRIHPIGNLKSCPVPPSMCGRVASLIFGLSESERYTCQCQVISLASETFVPCCPLLRRCRGSERVRDPSSAKRCIFEGFLLLSSPFSGLCAVTWRAFIMAIVTL